MRLHDTQRSGNAWKVRLLASLAGLPLARNTLSIGRGDLQSAEFARISPFAQVPVLELKDGAAIAESMAILFYLAQGTDYWPATNQLQTEVLSWLSFEQSQHMHPLAQRRLHLALLKDRNINDPDMVALQAPASKALLRLETRLRRPAASGWVVGDRVTIADIALYPYTRLAPMGGIELDHLPAIRDWLGRIEQLPGYEPLFPGQPGSNFSTVEILEAT